MPTEPARTLTPLVRETEAAWRAAWHAADRSPSERADRAESDAWDAYTNACHDTGKCLEIGCATYTPDHSYCPEHRDD